MPSAIIFDVDGTLTDPVDLHARTFPGMRDPFHRILRDGARIVRASARADEPGTHKRQARVDDLVRDETSSDDAEESEPYRDIFQAALSRLHGIDAADAVVVGDTPYDAEAAARDGLRTVGVRCGGFAEAALRNAGCMAIHRDPQDLLAQFDRSPLARRR